jgi:hypothetical protein
VIRPPIVRLQILVHQAPCQRGELDPPALYETLEEIAQQKKVLLAWVVRDAAEKYVASEEKEGRGSRLGSVRKLESVF